MEKEKDNIYLRLTFSEWKPVVFPSDRYTYTIPFLEFVGLSD